MPNLTLPQSNSTEKTGGNGRGKEGIKEKGTEGKEDSLTHQVSHFLSLCDLSRQAEVDEFDVLPILA